MASERKPVRLFKRATLKDIAREAGVSVTTVSNVLNQIKISSYSKETKDQILQIAKELNYEKNVTAKNLATSDSNTIVMLLPPYLLGELQHSPFYFHLLNGIENKATELGYDVLVRFLKVNETIEDLSTWASSRLIKGIIGVGEINPRLIVALYKLGIELVLVDNYTNFDMKKLHYINTMDEVGGMMAAKHLMEQGYKRPCIMTSAIDGEKVDGYRYRGFSRALDQAGMAFDLIVVQTTLYQEGMDMSYELRSMGVDGIFCTSDSLALGVVDGLTQLGISVPEEVGVIGFDDFSRSRETWKPLTTIHQDVVKKGEIAVDTLHNKEQSLNRLKVAVNLIKRATT